MDFGATGKGKDFKKGELIKALQKKYGKDKIKPNMTMGQLKKIMGNKDGALVAGMKAGIAGAGSGATKPKVQKPKEQIGKGSADPLTGKIITKKSVKEKEEAKKVKFKVVPSAYKRRKAGPKRRPTGMKQGDSVDFGMLSVKAGIDKNPNPTQADRIAGAKMKKKPEGAFIGKLFTQDKIKEMFSRVKGDPSIQDPEAYKKAYNKYATAYGNEPMKDDPKVATADQGKFIVRGMGAAIRGGKTKGSS